MEKDHGKFIVVQTRSLIAYCAITEQIYHLLTCWTFKYYDARNRFLHMMFSSWQVDAYSRSWGIFLKYW